MKSYENEILLLDRIDKIRAINQQYDLEHNAYLSFSGGKDSTILHYLLDMALPGNKIPRLFLNTGIEYKFIVEFVKELAKTDDRIVILNSGVNIKEMLEKEGYPFKSKQHSMNLDMYWRHRGEPYNRTLQRYLGVVESTTQIRCPKKLMYQFTPEFNLHCSAKCCDRLKKQPATKWAKENNKSIKLTGIRQDEGGQRLSATCIVTDKSDNLLKFHPLLVINKDFEEWFIEKFNIKLCKLYYPPYNFARSGCKGCPYNKNLQQDLDIIEELLPVESKQCEIIWKPIYDEYRRIGFRLKKE